MANSTRAWSRRKLDFAVGTLEKTIEHILEVAEIYSHDHKDISDKLVLTAQACDLLKTGILSAKNLV